VEERTLEETDEYLQKKIDGKRIELTNLKAQEQSLRVNMKAQGKIDDAKSQTWYNEKKKELSILHDKLDSRKNASEVKKDELDRREKAIEKREFANVDLAKKQEALRVERGDYVRYTREMDAKIARGKEIIEESKLVKGVLNQKASDLLIREEGIVKKEIEWSNSLYALQEKEKTLNVREANIEALKTEEMQNV